MTIFERQTKTKFFLFPEDGHQEIKTRVEVVIELLSKWKWTLLKKNILNNPKDKIDSFQGSGIFQINYNECDVKHYGQNRRVKK